VNRTGGQVTGPSWTSAGGFVPRPIGTGPARFISLVRSSQEDS
jgi:hypothetical protein